MSTTIPVTFPEQMTVPMAMGESVNPVIFEDQFSASAESLPAGSEATVDYGSYHFSFGIPRGDKGEQGERGLQGERGEQGVPGERGSDGTDGVSPTVTVTPITGGNRVTIVDADGTHTFNVMDGQDGERGERGERGETGATGADGFSPTITVTTITGGHRLTITDATGIQTVDVLNGAKGDPGQPGQDYVLTTADKQEIAGLVIADLPTWTSGGSY